MKHKKKIGTAYRLLFLLFALFVHYFFFLYFVSDDRMSPRPRSVLSFELFFSPFFWADTFKRYLLLVQTSLKKKSRQKIWFLFFVNLLQNLNTFQVMTVVGTSLISVSSKSTLDVHRPFSQKSNR